MNLDHIASIALLALRITSEDTRRDVRNTATK